MQIKGLGVPRALSPTLSLACLPRSQRIFLQRITRSLVRKLSIVPMEWLLSLEPFPCPSFSIPHLYTGLPLQPLSLVPEYCPWETTPTKRKTLPLSPLSSQLSCLPSITHPYTKPSPSPCVVCIGVRGLLYTSKLCYGFSEPERWKPHCLAQLNTYVGIKLEETEDTQLTTSYHCCPLKAPLCLGIEGQGLTLRWWAWLWDPNAGLIDGWVSGMVDFQKCSSGVASFAGASRRPGGRKVVQDREEVYKFPSLHVDTSGNLCPITWVNHT